MVVGTLPGGRYPDVSRDHPLRVPCRAPYSLCSLAYLLYLFIRISVKKYAHCSQGFAVLKKAPPLADQPHPRGKSGGGARPARSATTFPSHFSGAGGNIASIGKPCHCSQEGGKSPSYLEATSV